MKQKSIKQIFQQSNRLMLVVGIVPLLISIMFYTRYIFIYEKSIHTIQEANLISRKVKEEVLEDMWDVAFGLTKLESQATPPIILELREDIEVLQPRLHSTEEQTTLAVVLRTLDTLETYSNLLVANLETEKPVAENEEIMLQIEAINLLLYDLVQDFIQVEIQMAANTSSEVMQSVILISIFQLGMILAIIFFTKRNTRFLETNIKKPITNLIDMSNQLAVGHLNYRVTSPSVAEFQSLSHSMNKMADDLTHLLEENALKQYHLAQSEVKVLQAQITPHFVYNSLDAILALAEQEDWETLQQMTYALSDFFRISLSKGQDWIPLAKEIRHIEDYLQILQIRYGAMLTYTINCPTELYEYSVLKMILQPIVENAVYHGTKFVRRVGEITVNVWQEEQLLYFEVQDNGVGIPEEDLANIRKEINEGIDSNYEQGYGLYNVNKRLLLYYGSQAKLTIDSYYQQGTTVTIQVPKEPDRY